MPNDAATNSDLIENLDDSIAHWERLADAEIEKESIDARAGVWGGGAFNPYRKRAEVYRRTAEALKIQKATGVAVCSCCFKPFAKGC